MKYPLAAALQRAGVGLGGGFGGVRAVLPLAPKERGKSAAAELTPEGAIENDGQVSPLQDDGSFLDGAADNGGGGHSISTFMAAELGVVALLLFAIAVLLRQRKES